MAEYLVKKDNVISIIRGDTFSFKVRLNNELYDNLTSYEMESGDVLYFSLMKPNSTFEDSILIKEYIEADADSEGNVTVVLTPDDTELLPPGTYYYTVKLEKPATSEDVIKVFTVIQKTKFLIVD